MAGRRDFILLLALAGSASAEPRSRGEGPAALPAAATLLGSYDLVEDRLTGELVVLDAAALWRLSGGRRVDIAAGEPFSMLASVAQDPWRGDFVVADAGSASLYRVDPGGAVTTILSGAPLVSPVGLAFDPASGDLLVADRLARAVLRVDGGGRAELLASGDPLVRPIDVAIEPATGRALVLDEAGALWRIGAGGVLELLQRGLPLVAPARLVVDPATGDLLVTDPGASAVHRLKADGSLEALASGISFAPIGLASVGSGFVVGAAQGSLHALDARGVLGDQPEQSLYAPGGEVLEGILGHQFGDVPVTHPFHSFISDFAELEITGGCSLNPPLFCPESPVTRGQMAVFIVKAYKLLTVGNTNGALLDPPVLRGEQAPGARNLIGGDVSNSVQAGAAGATIAGGGEAAGGSNRVTDGFGSVGGGRGNVAGNSDGNTGNAGFATVAGGEVNRAAGARAAVGGGSSNSANGAHSVVSGGDSNQANGRGAMVPGGIGNVAAGDASLAAGTAAQALHPGSFVWGDSVIGAPIFSTAANQFLLRASGGVGINTTVPNAMLTVAGALSLAESGTQGATPGYGKLYPKVDHHLYYLDALGVEYDITLGGPTGPAGPTGPIGNTGPQGPAGTGSRPGFFRTTLDSTGTVGTYSSMAIGFDALPVLSYQAVGVGLRFARCANVECRSATALTVDAGAGAGGFSSITIGADGFPLIVHHDSGSSALKVVHCNDAACSSSSSATIDAAAGSTPWSSITIGTDGLGLISYHDSGTGSLKVAHCNNLACSSATIATVDPGPAVGLYSSITIGADGLGVVSYYDAGNLDLKLAHCSDAVCSVATLASPDTGGDVGQFTSIAVGNDGLPIVSYYDVTNQNLRSLHCGTPTCATALLNLAVTLDGAAEAVGQYSAITIGSDGNPVISYWDETNLALKVAHCQNEACGSILGASVARHSWDTGGVGQFTSIARGADGLPIVSYHDVSGGNLKVAHGSSVLALPYHRSR